jgi:hypothetical protein
MAKQVSISLYKCRTDRRAEGFLHSTSHNSIIHRNRLVANECPPLLLQVNMVNRLHKLYVGTKHNTCGSDKEEKHERDRPS